MSVTGRKVVLTLGRCVMTAGVAAVLSKGEVMGLLEMQTCEEDCASNDEAVRSGDARVVSLHETRVGKVFVITEWNRLLTTVMLASEY